MSADEDIEQLSSAERRLNEHLAVLRGTPHAPASLLPGIVRTARWQRALRLPLLSLGHLAATVGDTIRLLVGGRRR